MIVSEREVLLNLLASDADPSDTRHAILNDKERIAIHEAFLRAPKKPITCLEIFKKFKNVRVPNWKASLGE